MIEKDKTIQNYLINWIVQERLKYREKYIQQNYLIKIQKKESNKSPNTKISLRSKVCNRHGRFEIQRGWLVLNSIESTKQLMEVVSLNIDPSQHIHKATKTT